MPGAGDPWLPLGGRQYGLEILRGLGAIRSSCSQATAPTPLPAKADGLLESEWVQADAGHPHKNYRLTRTGGAGSTMARLWSGSRRVSVGCSHPFSRKDARHDARRRTMMSNGISIECARRSTGCRRGKSTRSFWSYAVTSQSNLALGATSGQRCARSGIPRYSQPNTGRIASRGRRSAPHLPSPSSTAFSCSGAGASRDGSSSR